MARVLSSNECAMAPGLCLQGFALGFLEQYQGEARWAGCGQEVVSEHRNIIL